MVQLVMDEGLKSYKVLVVGEPSHPSGHGTYMIAVVYCSETDAWSSAEAFPDLVFGYQYDWERIIDLDCDNDDFPDETCMGSCCAGRQLLEFNESNHCQGAGVDCYALVKTVYSCFSKSCLREQRRMGYVM